MHDQPGGDEAGRDGAPSYVKIPRRWYIGLLGVGFDRQGDECEGSAPVRPEMFAPGTTVLRTGHLATMVDLIAGHTPHGPYGPTVDLRVERFAPAPTEGRVHLLARPIRVGKRLIVAETRLWGDDPSRPFARALTTFLNIHMGAGVGPGHQEVAPVPAASFDEFFGVRFTGPLTAELDSRIELENGPQSTMQGGVQAAFAEIAAEHAVGAGRLVATNLDIRFLGKLRSGTVAAAVELLPSAHDHRAAVTLTDHGDGSLVAFVELTLAEA